MGWIHLTPNSDEWRFVLYAGINCFFFPLNAGNFFTSGRTIIISRMALPHLVSVLLK
jgi:hypothetical protein